MTTKPDTPLESSSSWNYADLSYQRVLQMLVLAAAYYIAGKLGAFLAIQPGYATAIWPASGIALAGILLFGYRAWPGVLIGSTLVNLSISSAGVHSMDAGVIIMVSSAIGCGATLQAVIGAYLVRRLAGFPSSLISEKEVYSTLFFGGLISTLISATISTSVLLAAGVIQPGNFLTNWGIWWLGDAMGVLIFTPLILVWTLRPVEMWRNRRMPITLVMITVLVLVTAMLSYATRKENERLQSEFEKDSAAMAVAIDKSLLAHLNVLSSLRSFFLASDEIDEEEFHTFVSQFFSDLHGVQALSWNRHILSTERDAYESSGQNAGDRNFNISERNNANKLVRAGSRPEYVVVSFIEPYAGNENALGYDVYSDAARKEAIDRARDSGEIAITSRVNLVQGSGNMPGVLAFMPIYRNNLSTKTQEDRRQNILGYVVAAFRIENVITMALKNINRDNLPYRLIDISAPPGEQLIYASGENPQAPVLLPEKGLFGGREFLASNSVIAIGGHQWQLEVIANQDYMGLRYPASKRLILLVGLLLTIMASALVLISTGRTNLLLRLVDKRTMELQASYSHLDKLASQVPGAIYQFRMFPDGHYSFPYASVGIHDVYEVTPAQVKEDAAPVFAVLHPDDRDAIEASIQESARTMQPWRCEYRVNLPVKGMRWLLGQANPEKLNDGSILWHGFITDITAQKEIEIKLRMLSTAIEQSPTSVVIANLDAEIEYANPTFTKVTGYSLAEVIGKNPRVLQSGLTEQSVYPELWGKLTQGQPWVGNFVNKRKNGEIYYEEAYISPVHDANGTISHYVAVKLDITKRKELEESVHAAARYTRNLIESSLDPLVTISAEGKITDVNAATESVTGLSRSDLIGTDYAMYCTDPEKARKGYQQVFLEGSVKDYPLAIRHTSGKVTDVLYNASVYRDENGEILGIFAAARDVTERKELEESIHAAARYTRSLIESSLDPLVTISADGKITDVNAATENVTGISRNDLIGTEFAQYFTDPEKARAGYQQVFAQGSVTDYMLAIQHVSGMVTDVLYNASVYRDEQGKVLGVFAAARDVTDIKHMQEEMRQLAFYDPLTMLPNRRLLIDRMSQAIAASKRNGHYGALMFLDLDNFKPLNDLHGHGVGDLLLIEVARRLKVGVREMDTVARIGGDEFVVMLTKLDKDRETARLKAAKVAEKIRIALAEPYILHVDDKDKPDATVEHHCTASMGVALFVGDNSSQDDIMKLADDAMYQAKEAGRNQVWFCDERV